MQSVLKSSKLFPIVLLSNEKTCLEIGRVFSGDMFADSTMLNH